MIANVKKKRRQAPVEDLESVVMAFRLPTPKVEKLDTITTEKKLIGVHSANQLCRHIVTQFLEGKLVPAGELTGLFTAG